MMNLKKMFILLLSVMIVVPAAYSQKNKQLEKARKKQYKSAMKRYEGEGWRLFGSPRSLEVSLLEYYEKLNTLGENGHAIVGTGKARSKNLLHKATLSSACTFYAAQAGSTVKGRMVSDGFYDADDLSSEFDRFYEAYETQVSKEIKGELREQFSMVRELPGGGYEMEAYFILDEDAASRARIRAYDNAAKESAAAQKYADKVAGFVRKGFDPNAGNTPAE